jgi:hypothetical protein
VEKKAGILSFEKFTFYNTINTLAGGDLLKWDEVMNLPYEKVFLKRLMNKTDAEFQKKYQDLMVKYK